MAPERRSIDERLGLLELFGLEPLGLRLREVAMALRGDEHTPPSRADLTSLKVLKPALALKTWLGIRRADGRTPLYNCFNHTPTPVEEGWSVRVTQVQDWRGGQRGYDSHNGTDFAVPPGTVVVAPAPGWVVRISGEFHRGGLKVVLDHGQGLMTTSNHLGRALVEVGDRVERGQPIALSGASGLDMVLFFPWNAPHVHFNTWLDGRSIDPFARRGTDEVAIWRGGEDPSPWDGGPVEADQGLEPTRWDPDAVQATIDACLDPALRAALDAIEDPQLRAADVVFHTLYFPTRFPHRPRLTQQKNPRRPVLDLPFRAEDFRGVAYS